MKANNSHQGKHQGKHRFKRMVKFLQLNEAQKVEIKAIKASAKRTDSAIVQFLITPGLWLQRITTNTPDLEQLEVAIAALKAALGDDYKDELVSEDIQTPETANAV